MSKNSKRSAVSSISGCSMTGYGKASHSTGSLLLEIEVKTLNNRNLDINIKLPRDYSEHEIKLREAAQKYFKRGRVDIQVIRSLKAESMPRVRFNKPLFEKVSKIFFEQAKRKKAFEHEFAQEAIIAVLSRKDVLDIGEEDKSDRTKEKQVLFKIFTQACLKVQVSRKREGKRLINDIKKRISALNKAVITISAAAATYQKKVRDNFKAKIKELGLERLEPGRLEQEVALLVMRSDITEELVRLDSHLKSLAAGLTGIDGKKLDFMLQEILREFNTIGSKCNDIKITANVVESKSNIERIREQSQNLE